MSGRIEVFNTKKEPTSKWSQNEAFQVREAGVDIGKTGGQGGGSDVSVDQVVTSGREVAGVTVDGQRTPIYIPNSGEWTQSDWAETDPSDDAYIKNKPSLAEVATSGSYEDLSDQPDLSSFVVDSEYVHTDYNYDLGAKTIVDHVTENLAGKVDKVQGKVLSDNNFTNEYKSKIYSMVPVYAIGSGLSFNSGTNTLSADAQPITIDSAMSSSSENPVQNKVITSALADKVDKVTGKGLSANDFTNAYKDKLDGIDQGAEVNDISTISLNGVNVPADANKNVEITIPETNIQLIYGVSTWNEFLLAMQAGSIVSCVYPNGDGSFRIVQLTRVELDANEAPAAVEFSNYHSLSSHDITDQTDQIDIYRLTNAGVWTTTTRNVASKIAAGTNMTASYANGTITLNATGGSGGLVPHLIIISEAGEDVVKAVKGSVEIIATETSAGHYECDVPEFGTWTIHAVLNGDDAQVSLNVDTVKVYTVDDSHFHADITVTFPHSLGATCALSATGQTTQYATSSPYDFTVHEAGTYTLTVSYDGTDYTDTITVTATGEEFESLLPAPEDAPTGDMNLWLFYADIDNSESTYSSLADILADTTALSALMASEDAVDYMVRNTSWATTITASEDAMTYIGLNNYASNTLLADSTWRTAICNSTYFESVLNVKVPTMTSNTTPNGICSADSTYSGRQPYYAFDGNTPTSWLSANNAGSNCRLMYRFDEAVTIYKASFYATGATVNETAYKVQGSNDGTTWNDLISGTFHVNPSPYGIDETVDFSNTNDYEYYGLLFVNANASSGCSYMTELQFYGREDV